ncbi:hypothetical protein [Motilimonas eburnea]|uniref:hypothetical protein n=1 Tax=Motilimonas eburnea TaxID=1737488 RepID=UPI001E3BCC77|nr:hypothetical protein [Motilimonas eburnea]MCE2571718.1 hypothetical protein [Motilimonas eburnea]
MATQLTTSRSDFRIVAATSLHGEGALQLRTPSAYVAPTNLNYVPWYAQSPVTGQKLSLNKTGRNKLNIAKPKFEDLQVVKYANDWRLILSSAWRLNILSELDIVDFIKLPQGSFAQVDKGNELRLEVIKAIEQQAKQYQQETEGGFAALNLPFPTKYIKNCEEVFGCISLSNISDQYDCNYNGFKLRLTRDSNLVVISAPVAKLSYSTPLKSAYYQFAKAISFLGRVMPSDDLLECATSMSMLGEACEDLTASDYEVIGTLVEDDDIIAWMTEHYPSSAEYLDDIYGENEWGVNVADYVHGKLALKQDFAMQQDNFLSMSDKLENLTVQLAALNENETEAEAALYLAHLISLLLSQYDFNASHFEPLSDMDLAYNCAMDFGFGFEEEYLESMNDYLAETGEIAIAHIDLSKGDYHRSLKNWVVANNVMCAFAEHVDRIVEAQ